MFETLEGQNRRTGAGRMLALLFSVSIHGLLVLLLVVLPLIFFHALPGAELLTFLIAAPEPPPPPPPPIPPTPPQERPQPERSVPIEGIVVEPDKIPVGIPVPVEEPQAAIVTGSLSGIGAGVLGATGLNTNLIPGSILASPQPPAPLPVPPPPRPAPMRTGGLVQESRLIHKVMPEYPRIALQARVSGTVALDIQVDEEGNVVGVKVLSGHPLLIEEAVRVVKLWKYSPTLLNGEPVPVISSVHVIFSMK